MVGYAEEEIDEGAPRTTGANKGGDKEQAVRSKSDGPVRRRTTVRRLQRTTRNVSVRPEKVAERNSKYHKRGDVYDEDCEVDGDMFYEIVTKQLIPDIYAKMADFDVVFVQMDNARPHVKRIADLERIGKKRKRIKGKQMPLIKFVLQPANSPDTNLNDLCFFRSLSKLVQEHEREIEHSAANRDKFWNLIVEQYHEFHSRETLERCWDVKTAVNKCILDAKGTNNYKLPHGIKHEEPVSHDISLDLDDTGDPVARTLDYEGLHASLPSSLPR